MNFGSFFLQIIDDFFFGDMATMEKEFRILFLKKKWRRKLIFGEMATLEPKKSFARFRAIFFLEISIDFCLFFLTTSLSLWEARATPPSHWPSRGTNGRARGAEPRPRRRGRSFNEAEGGWGGRERRRDAPKRPPAVGPWPLRRTVVSFFLTAPKIFLNKN